MTTLPTPDETLEERAAKVVAAMLERLPQAYASGSRNEIPVEARDEFVGWLASHEEDNPAPAGYQPVIRFAALSRFKDTLPVKGVEALTPVVNEALTVDGWAQIEKEGEMWLVKQ